MTTNASELPAASPTAGDVGMVLAQLVSSVDAVSLVSHSVDELNLLAGAVSGAVQRLGGFLCGIALEVEQRAQYGTYPETVATMNQAEAITTLTAHLTTANAGQGASDADGGSADRVGAGAEFYDVPGLGKVRMGDPVPDPANGVSIFDDPASDPAGAGAGAGARVGDAAASVGASTGVGCIRSLGSWVHSTCGVFVATGRVRRVVDVLRELSPRGARSEEAQLLRDALTSGQLTIQQVHMMRKEMRGVERLLSEEARPAVYAHLVDACEGATLKDIKHLVQVVRESLAINHPDALEEPAGPRCGPSMMRDLGLGADNRYGIELRLTPSDYAAFTNAVTALLATEPEEDTNTNDTTSEQQQSDATSGQNDSAPAQNDDAKPGENDSAPAQKDDEPSHGDGVASGSTSADTDVDASTAVTAEAEAYTDAGADAGSVGAEAGAVGVWGGVAEWMADAVSDSTSSGGGVVGESLMSFRDRIQEPEESDRLTALLVSVIEAGAARCGGPRATLVVTQRESDNGDKCHAHTRPGAPQPLTEHHAREVCCNATQYTETIDDKGNTVDLKVAKRYFTAHQRAALVARDQGCSFPGCNAPPHITDAHHIVHWQDGGPTTVDNGTLLCGYHHAQVHRHDLIATLEPVTDTSSHTSGNTSGSTSGNTVKKVRWDTRPGSYTRHIYTTRNHTT